ncbi:uroporphyrinogen-III synthase [Curtobacterium sp. VKM Ac-1393]|uniref:uroporphyrinogen-III synthase n=1 Tax=Curtobacterium sp. VKM Ac-1393 TaxID=2783814 RepID=UPI002B273D73|nr:uroporphyrinogen-III synthase [Curtobacterium sp. VKM Ac-1393]
MPRGGAWGERVATAARQRGLDPRVVPLIGSEPPLDGGPIDRAVARLAARPVADLPAHPVARPPEVPKSRHLDGLHRGGSEPRRRTDGESSHLDGERAPADGDRTPLAGYAWVVVTSATAVTVLAERVAGLPSGVQVAAVGEPTARAARAAGWVVDLVPEEASAAALVEALPDTDGTVLFPRSEIAAPTLVDGLRARGIDVDDVVAYRTVGTGDEPITLDAVPDAVLVTSGSVAREIARRMTPLDPRTLVACIGPGTAADARAAGLPVHVVGPTRSAEALLDAVVEALNPTVPEQEGHP